MISHHNYHTHQIYAPNKGSGDVNSRYGCDFFPVFEKIVLLHIAAASDEMGANRNVIAQTVEQASTASSGYYGGAGFKNLCGPLYTGLGQHSFGIVCGLLQGKRGNGFLNRREKLGVNA